MKLIKTLSILSVFVLVLVKCGSADNGAEFADRFFKLAIEEEYEKAGKMLEEKPNAKLNQVQAVERFANSPKYGKLKSAKKTFGFNTSIKNGVTTIELPYVLVYEDGEYNTNVTIVDRGMGMKITYIE